MSGLPQTMSSKWAGQAAPGEKTDPLLMLVRPGSCVRGVGGESSGMSARRTSSELLTDAAGADAQSSKLCRLRKRSHLLSSSGV